MQGLLTGAPQCAGPNQLCCHVAQLRVGSLRGVSEDGECLVLSDLVPLHQDAFGLFDDGSRRHRDAQVSKILAGSSYCVRSADRDRYPGGDLLAYDHIALPERVRTSGVSVERAYRCALER